MVTYNIHSLRDDQAALDEVVRGMAPDVLVVQESFRWFNPFTWLVNLRRRFGMAQAIGGLRARGNLVLTAAGVAVEEHWFVRYPLALGHYPRGAVFVRCSVGGTPFVVAGSHLSPDPAIRLRQANLFRGAVATAQEESEAPVLIGIDVNETPDGPAWALVAEGLVDTGAAADLPTFSTRAPERRIDAVFVDPRCGVLDSQTVDLPRSRVASDHFPVLAAVSLPPAG
jgi:LSD1 subclass zinc finger protein